MRSHPALCLILILLLLPAGVRALEVRVWPGDKIFLNESARRVGIWDLMVQNVVVINDGTEPVDLRPWRSWPWPKEPSSPWTVESQDSIDGFSRLLAGGISLSPIMRLARGTAVTVHKRLMSFSGYVVPDTTRLTATASASSRARPRSCGPVRAGRYL